MDLFLESFTYILMVVFGLSIIAVIFRIIFTFFK